MRLGCDELFDALFLVHVISSVLSKLACQRSQATLGKAFVHRKTQVCHKVMPCHKLAVPSNVSGMFRLCEVCVVHILLRFSSTSPM